jgi:hypothetical protein
VSLSILRAPVALEKHATILKTDRTFAKDQGLYYQHVHLPPSISFRYLHAVLAAKLENSAAS